MKLRFTIRDLLWLIALVAVCLAWRFSRPVPVAPSIGRYQWIGRDDGPGKNPMLFDTADGSVWEAHLEKFSFDKWYERVPKMPEH
jgi:hypothetical protein